MLIVLVGLRESKERIGPTCCNQNNRRYNTTIQQSKIARHSSISKYTCGNFPATCSCRIKYSSVQYIGKAVSYQQWTINWISWLVNWTQAVDYISCMSTSQGPALFYIGIFSDVSAPLPPSLSPLPPSHEQWFPKPPPLSSSNCTISMVLGLDGGIP